MSHNLKPGNIKKNLNTLGSNIKETGSHHLKPSNIKKNLDTLGSNFKDSITHSKGYNVDDELILHYQHDLKKSVKALKYLVHQVNKLTSSYWPKVFDSTLNITKLFIDLIGPDSLHFKGIESIYEEFDKFQAEQEIPTIHPKEKQIVIESMNHELLTFVSSVEHLKWNITSNWTINGQSMKIRISEMNSYLKSLIKLIDKRNSKNSEFHKISKKVEKLVKKSDPLSEKELSSLSSLEEKLKEVKAISSKLNDKTKSILPHALSLTDEFIEKITALILCNLWRSYSDINDCLEYFSTFYGYLSDHESKIPTYEQIKENWETSVTPAKAIVESSLSLIYNKNPELIDQDIDSEDKSTFQSKIWSNSNRKLHSKSHNFKLKDHVNGFFNDYLSADPLDSFENYADINSNKSSTYYPSKKINLEDIHPKLIDKPVPPLPPRENTAFKALPRTPQRSLPNPPLILQEELYNSESESDKDTDSIISDISISDSSVSSDIFTEKLSPDLIQNNLKNLYNKSKNEIKRVPMNPEANHFIKLKNTDIMNDTSTLSYKLKGFYEIFEKVLSLKQGEQKNDILVAKYDFDGEKIGDLSFKNGDKIEILLDFQKVSSLFKSNQRNWMIGSCKVGNEIRVGFVPNNYF